MKGTVARIVHGIGIGECVKAITRGMFHELLMQVIDIGRITHAKRIVPNRIRSEKVSDYFLMLYG